MNILFLSEIPFVPYIGGIQRVSENLALELSKRGYKIIYSYYDNYSPTREYSFPFKQYYLDGDIGEKCTLFNKIIEKEKINIIINQWPSDISLSLLKNVPFGIKKITCLHTQPFLNYKKERIIHANDEIKNIKDMLKKYTILLCPSIFRYISVKNQTKFYQNIIDVSNCFCLLSKYYINRINNIAPTLNTSKLCSIGNPCYNENIELKNKENRVIFVARMENSTKNIIGFIDVWYYFSKQYPNWQADVIGDGIDLERVKEYSRSKGCKNITFWGSIKNVNQFYEKARIVCVTSFYEGWSLVMLEGMSNGCIPFVFDTYEAVHEILDDRISGVICSEKCNPIEMSSEMCRVASDKQLLSDMSLAAFHKAKKFSIGSIVNQWEDLFNRI